LEEGVKAREGQVAASLQSQTSKSFADFSDEYAGLKPSIKVEGLGEVEGRLLKATRYWFKLSTSNGVLYINKARVIVVKPLELTPPRAVVSNLTKLCKFNTNFTRDC
jgi:hypothetical protein